MVVYLSRINSTVQCIVGARLVISGGQRGHLFMGHEIKATADASRSDIVRECQPLLAELTDITVEAALSETVKRLENMMANDWSGS